MTLVVSGVALACLILEGAFRVCALINNQRLLQNVDLSAESDLKPYKGGKNAPLKVIIRASANPKIIYELRPNLSVRYAGAKLRTNELGFRGPALKVRAAGRPKRFVGLGDSVLFGQGVEEQDSSMGQLQAYLNRERAVFGDWEVINMSVPGYNLAMEVEAFVEKGLKLEPQIVLYQYTGNDLALANFIREADDVYSVRRSFLLDFVASRWYEIPLPAAGLTRAPVQPFTGAFEDDPQKVPERYRCLVGQENFLQALDRLAKLSEERHFSLVISSWGALPAFLREVAAKLHIPLADPEKPIMEYLEQSGGPQASMRMLQLSAEDPHPNVQGHTILFESLRKAFLELHNRPTASPPRPRTE
jgi:hypothetical protein